MSEDFKPKNADVNFRRRIVADPDTGLVLKGPGKSEIDDQVRHIREEDLARPLPLKPEAFPGSSVERGGYLAQIAESHGLQTCYPTSLLNAWMHQGAMTRAEASGIQERFRSDLRRLFMRKQSYDYYTLAQNPYLFTELVGAEIGKGLRMYNMNVSRLETVSIAKIVLQELSKGRLLVVGDDIHATLVLGYQDYGRELVICDPMAPHARRIKNTQAVSRAIADCFDQYIAIIPRRL